MRILLALLLFAGMSTLSAQTYYPNIQFGATSPSGSCSSDQRLVYNLSTGALSGCDNGVWAAVTAACGTCTLNAAAATANYAMKGAGGQNTVASGVSIDASNNVSTPGTSSTTATTSGCRDSTGYSAGSPTHTVSHCAPDSVSADWTEYDPPTQGTAGQVRVNDGTGVTTWRTLVFIATSSSIGGSSLAAGACSSGNVTVTGATTAMSAAVSPVTYPGDGVDWHGYVSSTDTVTIKVCSLVANTPGASVYNVRVQ